LAAQPSLQPQRKAPVDPKDVDQLVRHGQDWLNKGNVERAIAELSAAILLNPTSAEAFFYRAQAWAHNGMVERAARGDAAAKDNFDRALLDYTEAVRLNPMAALTFTDRDDIAARLGGIDRAINHFNAVIQRDPNDASAFRSRAAAFILNSQTDRALVDLTRAIYLATNAHGRMEASQLIWAHMTRSILYGAKGLDGRELEDLGRVIELSAKPPPAPEGRDKDFAALTFPSLLASAYQRRANLYMRRGKNDQALAELARAIDADPAHAFAAYFDRAKVHASMGRNDQAVGDFHAALSINPGFQDAREALTRLSASR
jgi:tetratricopeptide (TPR) repeat protein